MSSKRPEVEAVADIRGPIDEAAKHVDLDHPARSHQCGSASTVHGTLISEDDQWRKLARVVETARAIWGGT